MLALFHAILYFLRMGISKHSDNAVSVILKFMAIYVRSSSSEVLVVSKGNARPSRLFYIVTLQYFVYMAYCQSSEEPYVECQIIVSALSLRCR